MFRLSSRLRGTLSLRRLQVVGSLIGENAWRDTLLVSLLAMASGAFQHLCLRLLEEYGFTDAEVAGRTRSDGGFFGYTSVEYEDLGRHCVPFLVKRYRGKVNAGIVRVELVSKVVEIASRQPSSLSGYCLLGAHR